MKFLLVLVVVLVAVWIWRHNRAEQARAEPPPRRQPPPPAPMVACRHCGIHLPLDHAVAGTLGYYCSTGHLRLGEPGR